MNFVKSFTDFKDIVAANPTFKYGYEDKITSENITERLILLVRSQYQIYNIYIYDNDTTTWDDFETNYKAGATL